VTAGKLFSASQPHEPPRVAVVCNMSPHRHWAAGCAPIAD